MRVRHGHLRLRIRNPLSRKLALAPPPLPQLQVSCNRGDVKFWINRYISEPDLNRPPSFLRVLYRKVEDLLTF